MVTSLVTALQFLTRFSVVSQPVVPAERFGAAVKYFPLIGLLLGGVSWLVYTVLDQYFSPVIGYLPAHAMVAIFVILPYLLTGALHADGLMDTCDGLFCGKGREDMLRIMKDSRVGAMGVTGFILYILLKWSLLLDVPLGKLPLALLLMPVVGRLAMVMAITVFPYARKQGHGHAFQAHAGYGSLAVAVLLAAPVLALAGTTGLQTAIVALGGAVLLCRYAQTRLGGLTGDVYGAVNEWAELLALLPFVIR